MKITNFLAILTLFILTACGGDESNTINPDAALTGTWEAQEFTANVTTTTEISGDVTEVKIDIEGKNLNYQLTISETAYNTEGSYGYEGNMEVGGDRSSFDESVSNVNGNGTYRVEESEFISDGAFFDFDFQGMNIAAAQGETKATIIKLTDTELIFSQDEEAIVEQSQGGTTFTITSKTESRSVWKRK